jgi:hypothetical protein
MSTPGEQTIPKPDATNRVADDVACAACGYNLRTQPLDGVCPECAQSVFYTVRGYYLEFAPPAWVRGLAFGLLLVLVALGGFVFVAPVISGVAGLLVSLSGGAFTGTPSVSDIMWIGHIQLFSYAIPVAVGIVGLVYLSQREPVPGGERIGQRTRRLLRLWCWLLPIPVVLQFILTYVMAPAAAVNPNNPGAILITMGSVIPASVLLGIGSLVIYATLPLILIAHVQSLMYRARRPKLERFARWVFWGLLIPGGLVLVVYTISILAFLQSLPAFAAMVTPPGPGTTTVTAPAPGMNQTLVTLGYVTPPATAPVSAPTTQPGVTATGSVSVTTAPASMPAGAALPRGFFGRMVTAAILTSLGSCAMIAFLIAAIILLFQAHGALRNAARSAAINAPRATPPAPGGAGVPPASA